MGQEDQRIPTDQMPPWLQEGIASENKIPRVRPPEQSATKNPLVFETPSWILEGLTCLDQDIAAQSTQEYQVPKTRTAELLTEIKPVKEPLKEITDEDKYQQTSYRAIILRCMREDSRILSRN